MILCPECKSEISENAMFCPKCGNRALKKLAGNKLVDLLSIASIVASLALCKNTAIPVIVTWLTWIIVYGVWYFKAKNNPYMNPIKLKKSFKALTTLFIIVVLVGFLIYKNFS